MNNRAEARFADLYATHSRRVYAYCRRRATADRAEEAMAEVFLTTWRRIDTVPDGEHALPWLYAVAFRVLSHQRRSHGRWSRLQAKLDAIGAVPPDPVDYIVVRRDEAQLALKAVERLKAKDAEVLRLAIWEELPHSDIARILGTSTAAVAQRLHRAKKGLTREFERLENKSKSSPAAQKGGGR